METLTINFIAYLEKLWEAKNNWFVIPHCYRFKLWFHIAAVYAMRTTWINKLNACDKQKPYVEIRNLNMMNFLNLESIRFSNIIYTFYLYWVSSFEPKIWGKYEESLRFRYNVICIEWRATWILARESFKPLPQFLWLIYQNHLFCAQLFLHSELE